MIKKIQTIRNGYNPLLFDFACGVITALLFSSFIYLEHFGITLKIINTLFGLLALALLLYIPKRAVLVAGFFIGLLWFYWIGYSFKYNDVGYMTPIITLLFALIYMLFFGILALTKSVAIRALVLFGLSFAKPFDFNWLQIELLFVDSYFGVYKYQLFLILLALSLSFYIKKSSYKYAPLLLLLLSININPAIQREAPLKIKLVATDIPQEKKWQKESLLPTIKLVFHEIHEAKNSGYDLILFPESVFPLFMNKAPQIIQELQNLSQDITIVAGSLLSEGELNYNVTYKFDKGTFEIAKKLVLVPFGEYIPLPKFAQDFINEIFFSGASDFKTATKPTDFTIKGVKFRNAICYEATCEEIYEGEVSYVLALSNNAWFAPSIEPTLQKLLMKYYARKNGATIYHSANYKGTGIIK
ncbi:apolipoprotein N-acyltransferase [Sulfurimonas sp.]|jgi:apolipoprotein N-acyltransferase|uniref:apolipoprotein N-acyltransferase n=1 Tax=Sulfurimonas sp. TaxID=2022749 RepID=UPI0025D15AC3|nr:apolipoprotein N-acyltransferase [Sulfurimonas sp.]MCK9472328.1 apolipoprotein N-acyltransferase [Sulfurimonas sp.]